MPILLGTTSPTVQYWNGTAWIDISTKVKSYTYTSGRQDEITGASAGQATFVLDNADSSVVAVGVNLLPKMTPIRVMVNGNTSPRWTGWVDGSPVTFRDPEGTSSLVTVTAADSIALMQRHVCQTSIYEETLAYAAQTGTVSGAFTPTACAYWPMSDPAGSSSAAEVTGTGLWGSLTGSGATFGVTGVNAAQTSAMSSNSGAQMNASPVGSGSVASGVTMGVWFQSSVSGPSPILLRLNFGTTSYLRLQINISGSAALLSFDPSSGSNGATYVTTACSDGQWHYLMGTMGSNGALALYLDGTLVATQAVAGWSPASTAVGAVSSIPYGGINVCHAWVGLGANAAAAAIYNAAALKLGSLTSTQFLGYLAKWALPQAPFGANSIDTQNNGTLTPGAGVTFTGNDCLTLAQVAADAEDGPLFCKRDGTIASLTHRSFADAAIGATVAAFVNGDVEADLTPARDAQYLCTNCQITALSGSGGVQVATNNLAKFGNYPIQKSLYVTDYQALDYATWKTQVYGDINYSRIGKFTIDLLNSVDIQAAALALNIGSRATFTGLPAQAGFTTADVIVQGFTEDWTIDGWRIAFNTTPSSSYISWILEDATYGLLDSTTVLGY